MLLYHWYELGHAAFRPAQSRSGLLPAVLQSPQSADAHAGRPQRVAACEVFERATRRYSKPDFGISRTKVDGHTGGSDRGGRVADAVLPPRPLQARHRSGAAPRATRACCWWRPCRAISPRCCAARSRRSCPTTRSTSPTGRTRATCRCPAGSFDLDDYIDTMARHVPLLRRRRARVRGVPAVGAGAGRHRADGGGRRSGRAADADPRRRPDRHAHQPDRRQHAGREARHRLVPPQRHHQRALAVRRAAAARSIRASCSCRAS